MQAEEAPFKREAIEEERKGINVDIYTLILCYTSKGGSRRREKIIMSC